MKNLKIVGSAFVAAMLCSMVMAGCGNKAAKTESVKDSTMVTVDSTAVDSASVDSVATDTVDAEAED